MRKHSQENKSSKNNDNKFDKKEKKHEIQSKEKNRKSTYESSNIINRNLKSSINYPPNKRFKKLSLPMTSAGTVFVSNTENNLNELNQCQNIIIPKGNTVININNNYFDQIASSTLPMGYCTNQNCKKTSESKNNNNYLAIRRTNTNNYTKNAKKTSCERKTQYSKKEKVKKNKNSESCNKNYINNNKRYHYKQISQDYLSQKNKNEIKEKYITKNDKNDNDKKATKEKIMKFGSFSPQPIITNSDIPKTLKKKLELTKNSLKNENITYKNYLTETNEPNLITRYTKGNVEEEDNKEKEKLFLHIRDLIEKKKKEKNNKFENESNPLLLYKKNKIQLKNENKNNFDLSHFSKYKTISNFKGEKKKFKKKTSEGNFEEKIFNHNNKKELMYVTSETFLSKKRLNSNKKNDKRKEIDKENEKNKSQKLNINIEFNTLDIKENKIKTKGKMDNNKNNNNNNFVVNTKLNKDKNKKLLRQISNNLKNSKNIFTNLNTDNNIIRTSENNKNKKNKLLNQRKKHLLYNHTTEVQSKKSVNTFSHNSLLYKSPMSQLTTLLMSHKKEEEEYLGNNATTKYFDKGKFKNIKFGKDDLNLEIINHNINSSCNYNSINNLNKKIALTEQNKKDENRDSYNIGLSKINNINNTDLRNKYRSYLSKKNKQKSCELENHSAIQKKMNTELLERMNLIKQKNKNNNFYQKYKENKVILGDIKTYLGKNIGSFDNSSNSNIHSNSIGNLNSFLKNNVHYDCMYQTPSVENKKLGLYKKVMKPKIQLGKSDKKLGDKEGNNYDTPSAIKVNRTKFLEKVKEKIFDNKKMLSMNNLNSYICHKNL